VFGTFVYFMVNFYGSKTAGRLDSDPDKEVDAAHSKESGDEQKSAESVTSDQK
jgi:hypothetical protein